LSTTFPNPTFYVIVPPVSRIVEIPHYEGISTGVTRANEEIISNQFLVQILYKIMDKTALVNEMFAVGAHYGYTKTRRHPSTKPFLYGTKNRTDIIDLEKTADALATAQEIMKTLGTTGKQVLFVGTKPEARDVTIAAANALGMPYVDIRWIGGTLTNEKQIKSRVTLFDDLSEKKDKGELETITKTKKEKLLLERKIEKLGRRFGGLGSMKGLPAALVVIDAREEEIAVTEANQIGIPVIGLCNTDSNIKTVAYPVIANDANKKSIEFFLNKLVTAYKGN
jgi:small subunit ribosomal protein S2